MKINDILRNIELFNGLTDIELNHVADICHERILSPGDTIAVQGESSSELYIITDGLIEISIYDKQDPSHHQVIANLGSGQIIGEMGLVDQGSRSATVRATTQHTIIQVIHYDDLIKLCDEHTHIGYIIMRNLAADISFKLRRRNLVSG